MKMKVVIFDECFIPGLGKGPFKEPIEISPDKYSLYKRMKLRIYDVSNKASIVETGISNREVRNYASATNEEKKVINAVTNANLPIENEETEAEIEEILNTAEKTVVANTPNVENEDIQEIDDSEEEDTVEDIETEEDIVAEDVEETSEDDTYEEDEVSEDEDDESLDTYLRGLTKKEIIEYAKENDLFNDELTKMNKDTLIDTICSM